MATQNISRTPIITSSKANQQVESPALASDLRTPSRPNRKSKLYQSKAIVSQVHYNEKQLTVIFHEIKQGSRDYLTFKDMLQALSAYKIDLNSGRQVTKDEYISMSKYMFMQICQQAELSIHLSQYKDDGLSARRSPTPLKNSRQTASPMKSARGATKHSSAATNMGNPLFETAQPRKNTLVTKITDADRSQNNVLTLDKDINEMQLTWDMFRDCLNQFSCLRQIAQCIHAEMGLESELNVTRAIMAMKNKTDSSGKLPGVLVRENSNPLNSSLGQRSVGRPGSSDPRMSTIKFRRLQTQESGLVNLVDNDDDIDLNFVVHGDFMDEKDFNPVMNTDGQGEAGEPEEINNDFGDEDGNFAIPIDKESDAPGSGRQTSINTFAFPDNRPEFLKGVPSDLKNQGRGDSLGSAVVSLSSKSKFGQQQVTRHSEMVHVTNRDTHVRHGQDLGLHEVDNPDLNARYQRNPTHRETQLPMQSIDYRKRPSEADRVVMDSQDLDQRKKSRKRSSHQNGVNRIDEEGVDSGSSDELSLGAIDLHMEKQNQDSRQQNDSQSSYDSKLIDRNAQKRANSSAKRPKQSIEKSDMKDQKDGQKQNKKKKKDTKKACCGGCTVF